MYERGDLVDPGTVAARFWQLVVPGVETGSVVDLRNVR
jgi:hypothetical protein